MWIRTPYDALVHLEHFDHIKIEEEQEQWVLRAFAVNQSGSVRLFTDLARYTSEARAQKELDELCAALHSDTNIYTMSKEAHP